ncbi:MAG: glycerophosphodiester phosphodiesterase [Leptospira sp.]|nr:glycerophosphodiester phosphodiesterase [Leptospira sp.]
MNKLKVIAHRGYSGHYPENTLLSFQRAIDVGSDMIEFDITVTSDFVPIVIHDDKLNRTTNGKGKVRSVHYKTISSLDAGSWFDRDYRGEKIPLLQEVLEFTAKKNIALNIEIKPEAHDKRVSDKNIESQILPHLRQYRLIDRVIISSFSPSVLQRMRKLSETIPLAFLFEKKTKEVTDPFEFCRELSINVLNVPKNLGKKNFIIDAHNKNIEVNIYTVNSEKEMRDVIECEPDGIFTNFPERLQKLLSEISLPRK